MKVGDTVKIVAYPDEWLIGREGEIVDMGYDPGDYIEIALNDGPVSTDRPWDNLLLCNDDEIEAI